MSRESSSPPDSARETAQGESSLQVKGNAPIDVKRQCLQLMHVFVLKPDKSYAANVGRCLKLVEVNIWDKGRKFSRPTDSDRGEPEVAETVFETTVEEGGFARIFHYSCGLLLHVLLWKSEMVNSLGVLHGGCAAYIIDMWVLFITGIGRSEDRSLKLAKKKKTVALHRPF